MRILLPPTPGSQWIHRPLHSPPCSIALPPLPSHCLLQTERYADIVAANPGLSVDTDRRTLLAVGSAFWRDELTPEERKVYKEKAAGAF